jgi:hypothetical protein
LFVSIVPQLKQVASIAIGIGVVIGLGRHASRLKYGPKPDTNPDGGPDKYHVRVN